MKRRVDGARRDGIQADTVFRVLHCEVWVIVSRIPLVIIGTDAFTKKYELKTRCMSEGFYIRNTDEYNLVFSRLQPAARQSSDSSDRQRVN
jgi:hypothetical protein